MTNKELLNDTVTFNRNNMDSDRDRIRGSLIGGAVGDALGYAVEFDREKEIFKRFGQNGITEYELYKGKAIISDDTQMTLFTAEGILASDKNNKEELPRTYVARAYDNWFITQTANIKKMSKIDSDSELLREPELYARRAPGNTCLFALEARDHTIKDYVKNPVNHSKGCGGIMRIAPVALGYIPGKNYSGTTASVDMEAAQIAAITHGHSLGYMPAAVFSHVITGIMLSKDSRSLKEIVIDARDTAKELFAKDANLEKLIRIIDLAIELSENDKKDLDNIHALGEGWVAEETLGIALYCSLKYSTDFSAAVIAAVNHNGDSDSTGAVTGNIVGALTGYEHIEDKWKKNLELHDVILKMADDLSLRR